MFHQRVPSKLEGLSGDAAFLPHRPLYQPFQRGPNHRSRAARAGPARISERSIGLVSIGCLGRTARIPGKHPTPGGYLYRRLFSALCQVPRCWLFLKKLELPLSPLSDVWAGKGRLPPQGKTKAGGHIGRPPKSDVKPSAALQPGSAAGCPPGSAGNSPGSGGHIR